MHSHKSIPEKLVEQTSSRYYSSGNIYIPKKKGDDVIANFCLYECPHADSKCRGTCPEIRKFEKEIEKKDKRRNTNAL